jgi:endonuclease-8
MPEGDSIAKLARAMSRVLLGRRIESVDSRVAEVDERLVHEATVVDIRAHGKNLLIDMSSGFTLHSHLLMRGRWRIRPLTEARLLPADTRLAMRTSEVEAFCTAQIVRLVKTDRISRDPKLGRLGPDPLHDGFQVAEVVQRMRGSPARELGDIVLDQAVMSGIGNVLKSEGLFLAGADPFAAVGSYDDAQLHAIIQSLAKVLRDNAAPRLSLDRKGGRMTRRTDEAFRGGASRLWVYDKSGQPCLVCGTRVLMKPQGEHVRSTYWCRRCQPPHAAPSDGLAPPLRER